MTGFSDPDFVSLQTLIQDVRSARSALVTGLTSVRTRLPRLKSMVGAVRALPRLTLTLSTSPEGEEIAELLSRTRALVPARVAVSVLALPDNPEDYLRGRKRQAVRTNVTQARAEGIVCREETSPEEFRRRVLDVLGHRNNPDYERQLMDRVDQKAGEFWVAVGANDKTIAFAIVTVDTEVARLAWMLSAKNEGHSAARYLLSTEIFTDLTRRKVKYIIADCAFFLPEGIVYFQRLLGFQPMNLVVQRTNSRRWLP